MWAVSETDFAEFIRILKRRRARFLVIGGYAMAHHGLLRATNDVDVLIATDDTNRARVRNVDAKCAKSRSWPRGAAGTPAPRERPTLTPTHG